MGFKAFVRQQRQENFPSSLDIVHQTFLNLKLDKKNPDYFISNASDVVETLREENWNTFLDVEHQFSVDILKHLISKDKINDYSSPYEAVENYIENNVARMYDLALSNTQSRRSRAGNEFEAILTHLFMGAKIPFEEQGLIGSGIFEGKHLAKLVDHLIPGSIEYTIDKRNTIAISAKTTLRERWQQIGDEMNRTKMPEIYLATLDNKIGKNTLEQLRNNNIYPATTKKIKEEKYKDDTIVITFEDLLKDLVRIAHVWTVDHYTLDQIETQKERLNQAILNQSDKPYIQNYLRERLAFFSQNQ